jgi:excisionase family DNA binding protein
MLRLNPQTVRNTIDRGELAAIRVGPRRVRVRKSALDLPRRKRFGGWRKDDLIGQGDE